jgi:hypothetical protein
MNLAEVLGYLSLCLGTAALLYGLCELIKFLTFALRKENQIRVQFWGIPLATIKDEEKFNLAFSRALKAMVCCAVLIAIGSYLLGLPITVNGNKVQGGP